MTPFTAEDPRHGTNAGYIQHFIHKIPSCTPCRAAHREYKQQAARRRAAQDAPRFHIDATGTRRRIRALMRIGWRYRDLDQWLGQGKTLHNLNRSDTHTVHIDSARRVIALYNALSMTPGPSEQTRQRAQTRGWPSPLCWDDDTIDDPKARPAGLEKTTYRHRHELDEAAVIRVVRDGRRAEEITANLTKAERAEVVRRLRLAQWSDKQIEEHTGIRADRYSRVNADREKAAA